MKVEIELSEKQYNDLRRAAKNLKLSPKKFVMRAIRRVTRSHQKPREDITASLNNFFAKYPHLAAMEEQQRWDPVEQND